MIELSKAEKQFIKFCKLHYKDQYPMRGSWVEILKPLFTEIYGWNPDENNSNYEYLGCLFNKLLDIHLKIEDDNTNTRGQLKSIFTASFYKSFAIDDNLPIERAISCLCGLIQGNTVIVDDVERYSLDIE
jgi:hypothetical protein